MGSRRRKQPAAERSLETLAFRSAKRARDMFVGEYGRPVLAEETSLNLKRASKIFAEYSRVKDIPAPNSKKATAAAAAAAGGAQQAEKKSKLIPLAITDGKQGAAGPKKKKSKELALVQTARSAAESALALRAPAIPKPQWHPHWKLMRVISGHLGWVRCVTVDPSNQYFVTGSGDRTIKIWDLASGTLRLSLTGHVSAVRGVAVSDRHPYLFSCGEDKMVKCWDLEQNKVVRHYHGHLSACYGLALHPTLDMLFTCSRDATIRAWDMRTKSQVHCLTGHTSTVASVVANSVDPQIISGSHDNTIRLWDLAAGKSIASLTNHKKSIRSLALHPKEFTFASGAADNIKQWYLPGGKFIQNLSGHNAVVNSIAINADGVLVSGADNGTLNFWDYKTGHRFQEEIIAPQPGSLDSESGVFAMTFDQSGSRLITAEADKTIKIYKEDPLSTPETHPLKWRPGIIKRTRY